MSGNLARNSVLAALMASCIAQCTYAANRSDGSPDALEEGSRFNLVVRAIDELHVQLLRDHVRRRDLICPRAVVDHKSLHVRRILLIREETNSQHKMIEEEAGRGGASYCRC